MKHIKTEEIGDKHRVTIDFTENDIDMFDDIAYGPIMDGDSVGNNAVASKYDNFLDRFYKILTKEVD